MHPLLAPRSPIVNAKYRGWLSLNERGELYMLGEGDLLKVLQRDRARFGNEVRLRFFSANQEFPAEQLKGQRWKSEGAIRVDSLMRTRNLDLLAPLRQHIGKFVHLEVEWRR